MMFMFLVKHKLEFYVHYQRLHATSATNNNPTVRYQGKEKEPLH